MKASRRIVTRSILSSGSRMTRYAGRTSRNTVFTRTFANGSRSLWTQALKSRKRTSYGVFAGIVIGSSLAGSILSSDSAPKADWEQIKKEILAILSNDKHDDGSYGPVLIRLAWHASGTYDKNAKNGGSNGATMRFKPESDHGANAGLAVARNLLEPIKKRYPEISYADLWTFAGVVAVEAMGGPKIKWRPGRTDAKDSPTACPPDGRLPDASKGKDHIRDIFYRMGFNDREIVALLGAHAVGRAHTQNSGYDGPWTTSPIAFTNEFYVQLLEAKWVERKWNGPKQFTEESGTLMMLPTDLALINDPEFRKYVELYAKDEKAFFTDFAAAFGKLLELGVPFETSLGKDAPAAPAKQKSWWNRIFG